MCNNKLKLNFMKTMQFFLRTPSFLLVLFSCILINASFGQSLFDEKKSDYADIILTCLNAEQIQPYLQLDENGNPKPIVIKYWHPIIHPVDLELSLQGNSIHFTPMSPPSVVDVDAYFLFREFQIVDASALVRLHYAYFNSGNKPEWEAEISLAKNDKAWEIIGFNLITNN